MLLFGFVLALVLCVLAGMAAISALGLFQRRTAPTPTMIARPPTSARLPQPTPSLRPETPTEPLASPTAEAHLPDTPTPVVITVQPAVETPPPPLPTNTPTPTPTPTRTPTSTRTPTPSPSPTATPTPTPSPYAGPYREGNGVDLRARRASLAPRLDGDLMEWEGVIGQDLSYIISGAQAYEGMHDIAGTVYAQWDEEYLYLAARVTDDVHVQSQRGDRIDLGDALIVWIDVDLAGDFDADVANGDDYQIGLSPGDFATISPEAVVWRPQRRPEWDRAIIVGARRRGGGYTLEAAIPWMVLGWRPVPGWAFGFSVQLLDNDTRGFAGVETILSGAPNMRPGAPSTFGNLILSRD